MRKQNGTLKRVGSLQTDLYNLKNVFQPVKPQVLQYNKNDFTHSAMFVDNAYKNTCNSLAHNQHSLNIILVRVIIIIIKLCVPRKVL